MMNTLWEALFWFIDTAIAFTAFAIFVAVVLCVVAAWFGALGR